MKNTSDHAYNPKPRADPKSELAYIKQARLGGYVGERAKVKLIRDYYPWIQQRCGQILRNNADAQDATQEVMLRMHKALPQFEGNSSLRTWLSTIVHNECVNLMRRQQKNTLTLQTAALIALFEAEQDSGSHSEAVPVDAVHNALDALSGHDREILHLRFFGELPIAEIGSLLDLSLSATKMRLYRALEAFKSHFREVLSAASALPG
jgi:RNA polymerase sigma-70 factor (ECF subfamily)